jgi:hypothetical protein
LVGLIVDFELSEFVGDWVVAFIVELLKFLSLVELFAQMGDDEFSPLFFEFFLVGFGLGSELIGDVLEVLIQETLDQVILKLEYDDAIVNLFALIFAFSSDELTDFTNLSKQRLSWLKITVERECLEGPIYRVFRFLLRLLD